MVLRRLLGPALAGALAGAPLLAVSDGLDAADAQEVVETLLGLEPARYADPLAAMKGWGTLYVRLREASAAGDGAVLRLFLLMAKTTRLRADAASSQAFSTDLLGVFMAQPEAFRAALADNPWLVDTACHFLGKAFEAEDGVGAGRMSRDDLAKAITTPEAALSLVPELPAAAVADCAALIAHPGPSFR